MMPRSAQPHVEVAADERDPSAAEAELPGIFGTATPTVIAFVIATCIAWDLVADFLERAPPVHMAGMAIGCALSVVALAVMWRLMRASRAHARALKVALDSTRCDLVQWRARTSEMLQGLGALIDRQFVDWALSSAEREVGLLLLKGLSLKAIAEVRATSERTVRQQALAIYRKAGVAGRAELSAFFLEDLLLPRDDRAAGAPVERAAAANRG